MGLKAIRPGNTDFGNPNRASTKNETVFLLRREGDGLLRFFFRTETVLLMAGDYSNTSPHSSSMIGLDVKGGV